MNMIKNREKVTDIFGYWPQFCDARFISFSYENANQINVSIFYIDVDKSKEATISISFIDVSEVQLTDLLSNNYIDEILITETTPHVVTIDGCYGLNGSFKCVGIEVLNVST